MTREIPPTEWKQFFDNLSRDLSDWITSIEIVRDTNGSQFLVREMPFAGAIVTTKDNQPENIEIMLGEKGDGHESHWIPNPQRVSFLQNKNLPGCLVAVKSADGTKTMINIQRPLPALLGFAEHQIVSNVY